MYYYLRRDVKEWVSKPTISQIKMKVYSPQVLFLFRVKPQAVSCHAALIHFKVSLTQRSILFLLAHISPTKINGR